MVDFSKRPEKMAWLAFFITAILMLFTAALTGFWINSMVVSSCVFPLTIAALMALVAAWRTYLVRKERDEAEEREQVQAEFDRDDLFDDRDDALKMAETARKQFDKWAVYIFTLFIAVGLIGIGLIVFRNWNALLDPGMSEVLKTKLEYRNPQAAAGVSLLMLLATLIYGGFLNGLSREPGNRWLRPVAQWLLFASLTFLIALVVLVVDMITGRNPSLGSTSHWDIYGANLIVLLNIAFGIELAINFIIEFFRPRTRGAEIRPLYESRILALVTEPGGVAHNVSHALNYQFGFEVSETWFYTFVERSFIPFLILLGVTFYLLTCFARIEADQMAVRLHFGSARKNRVDGPGFHFKAPWPIHSYRMYDVKAVKELTIGVTYFAEGEAPSDMEDPMIGDPTGKVIVWDKKHAKEETNFLTAAQSTEQGEGPVAVEEAVPVNFVTPNITIYYKILEDPEQVLAYAFNYENPDEALRQIAQREIVEYLASTKLTKLIGEDYEKAQNALEQRIRDRVDKRRDIRGQSLGLEVLHVALVAAHPPTEVAAAFQNVIVSEEEKRRIINEAIRDATVKKIEAQGEHDAIVARAEAYRIRKQTVPQSEVNRYLAQLENFRAAPDVFRMREYLAVLLDITESKDIRRYVVATSNANRLTEILFKEKPPGLEDLDTEQQ